MTGPDEPSPLVIIATSLEHYRSLPPVTRELAAKADGPYTELYCSYCGQLALVSKDGCMRLRCGQADSVMCSDCLVAMVKQNEGEK